MPVMLLTIFAAAVAAQAPAADNEVRLFSRGGFAGASISAVGPRRDIPPFTVKSVQMAPGTSWELCNGETFTHCKIFSGSDKAMVMTVRSVRPVAAPIASTGAVTPAGLGAASNGVVSANGGSLRGLASEFFVTPGSGGARIAADQASMTARATEFCRAHGWRLSVHTRVQAVGGVTYLADVLCADEQ